MPLFDADAIVPALLRGVPYLVFEDETPGDNNASISVALAYRTGFAQNVTFEVIFPVGIPATVDFRLQEALVNEEDNFHDVGSPMTNINGGKITVPDMNARFVRVIPVDAGGGVDVTVRVSQA